MANVCILSTVHDFDNTRIFHKMAETAINAGFNVEYIVHDPPKKDESEVTFHSLGHNRSRFQRWSHLPRAYSVAHSINSDIYHIHDPELLPVGVLLQATTNASVIYDAHEDYGHNAIEYREWIPEKIRPIIKKVFPKVQSAFANQLDGVITTTESIAEHFQDFGHSNVEVIHNYPKTVDVKITEPPIVQSKEITLVYVGSFEHIHGLLPMLRLVRELVRRGNSAELWMLGSFDTKYHEHRANQFIETNNLTNNVKFVGQIPYEDIFSYISRADVGLCLVDRKRCEHALPTKIFEYMYSMTPVLATDARSIRQYVTEEIGYLVSQKDSEEQADAIMELTSDTNRLKEMGMRGRQLVENRYNWETEAEKLVSIYESII